MVKGEDAPVLAGSSLLPNHRCDEIRTSKDLVAQDFQIMTFVVINRDPERAIVAKQPMH